MVNKKDMAPSSARAHPQPITFIRKLVNGSSIIAQQIARNNVDRQYRAGVEPGTVAGL